MNKPTDSEIRDILGESDESLLKAWSPGDPLAILAWGPAGVGKTHLGMTFPKPIFAFDFDLNMNETMRQFQGQNIFKRTFMVPPLGEWLRAKELADRFLKEYYEALTKLERLGKSTGVYGSVMLDSVTQLWDLLRYAYVPMDADGRTKSAWNYGGVNNKYQALFMEAKNRGVNLFAAARSKNVWTENEKGNRVKTTLQEIDCKDETLFLSSVVTEVAVEDRYVKGKLERQRVYKIRKCSANGNLTGLESGKLDYPTLIELIESM